MTFKQGQRFRVTQTGMALTIVKELFGMINLEDQSGQKHAATARQIENALFQKEWVRLPDETKGLWEN